MGRRALRTLAGALADLVVPAVWLPDLQSVARGRRRHPGSRRPARDDRRLAAGPASAIEGSASPTGPSSSRRWPPSRCGATSRSTAPDYGTDEIAFDQYAAHLALQGLNPYAHSMAAAFPLFHVSPNGYTFRLNGQP